MEKNNPSPPHHFLKQEHLDFVENVLELNNHDYISLSLPKTGSTRINEILFVIKCDLDEDKIKSASHLDKTIFVDRGFPGEEHGIKKIDTMPSPRILKTHLPLKFYKRNIMKGKNGPKCVVAMRNPKDTMVSGFHFSKVLKMNPEDMTFDEFFNKELSCGLQFWEWNLSCWQFRDHENIHIVKYEDMIADPFTETKKIVEFLGKPYGDDEIRKIVELTSFNSMKKKMLDEADNLNEKQLSNPMAKPMLQKFFRKGEVGDWKNYLSEEQSKEIDELCEKHYAPEELFFRYQ